MKNELIIVENQDIQVPENVQVGDIIVAKYENSQWAGYLPWENWHHVALISNLNPLTIIEAPGRLQLGEASIGPREITFQKSKLWGNAGEIKEILWLQPKFPKPIRKKSEWWVPRFLRATLTEKEAREKVVQFAKDQKDENYSEKSSKWSTNKWYCSLLVFKSYSMTITGMYLEDYSHPARGGYWVTPEDIVDSLRTEKYFYWKKKK